MTKAILFAERFFKDGKQIGTKYGLEGNVLEVGGLRNCSMKDLANELRWRIGKESPLIYSNSQDSEIVVSHTGLEVRITLKTGLTPEELKELSKLTARNLTKYPNQL